ncbi:unnamed protein product [Cuscuta epithymum]|uniref:Uncharacterized protein n=1 Tax=Cuscuta epithymum TaxID=186058 RepID=A0AAV0D3A6_9ASTE|nr:unnamed protein product [Cuscuta epithymum]
MAYLSMRHTLSSLPIKHFTPLTKMPCNCSTFSSLVTKSGSRRIFRSCSTWNRKFRLLIDPKLRVSCTVQDNENPSEGEEPPESLFVKELKRRGMTPTSLLEESNKKIYESGTTIKEEDGNLFRKSAVSTESGRNLYNQREQSMALNSEGIEGLIPRAKLLLTLGGSFFLGFGPLILVIIAFFSALYVYSGPKFIHDASNTHITPPKYVDPYALLEEERISQKANDLKF